MVLVSISEALDNESDVKPSENICPFFFPLCSPSAFGVRIARFHPGFHEGVLMHRVDAGRFKRSFVVATLVLSC